MKCTEEALRAYRPSYTECVDAMESVGPGYRPGYSDEKLRDIQIAWDRKEARRFRNEEKKYEEKIPEDYEVHTDTSDTESNTEINSEETTIYEDNSLINSPITSGYTNYFDPPHPF